MRNMTWLREQVRYPCHYARDTSYRDLDALGHVNNVTVAAYYDDARERMTRAIFQGLDGDERGRVVTAQSTVTFLAEVFHPTVLDIASGVLKIGSSSWEIGQAIFLDSRCLGLCSTTLVQADAEGGRPLGLSMRARLENNMIKPPSPSLP